MRTMQGILGILAILAAGRLVSPAAAATLDRFYRMGDEPAEGAANGAAVNMTFDSAGQSGMGQLVDLTAVNSPTYVAISGRPDGGGGRGIQFNAAQSQYLHGYNLGFPEDSFSAASHHTPNGGSLDYLGISNRGLQFWVRPTSTATQTIVMDTNQHGVRIDSNGNFSMRYAGLDYASSVPVVPNTWYHVEVVRPAGAANGSRMYVNGVAVAAAPGGYNDDRADLTVGTNTAGDDQPSPGFTGGTGEFFSGTVDDLKMFVIGRSTSAAPVDYGTFNPAVDNDFIASPTSGIKGIAGDVNNDGLLTQADKDAFIAGWLDRRLVNGIQVPDLISRGQGDLNLDGITDLHDLVLLQGALPAAGLAMISAAELRAAVPEPSSLALLLLTSMAILSRRASERFIIRTCRPQNEA